MDSLKTSILFSKASRIPLLGLVMMCIISTIGASEPEGEGQSAQSFQQLISAPPPAYQSMPSAPPAYQLEPSQPRLAHELEIRKTQARNLFFPVMQKIYQNRNTKQVIQQQFPHLTPAQLLEHTRKQKEIDMDAQGLAFLQKQLPEVPVEQLRKSVQTYKQEFFGDQSATSACCSCCCYHNGSSCVNDQWANDDPCCCLFPCWKK